MNLVNAKGAVREEYYDSVESYGVLDSCDFLCAGRWVKSTLVLLSYLLDKGTVVVADAYSETYLVISVSLQALKTSLDFLYLSIYSQVVLEN